MKKIYKTLLTTRATLTMLLMGILLLAANAGFGQATVSTDKADYLPGEMVEITGAGFTSGETVTIVI